jgi:transcriptional regulator with XRE-family HTH domain
MTRCESGATHSDASAIAEHIALARKINRMTQAQLADAALISVSLLRKIERGKRAATPAVLASIAHALGVDGSQLSGDPQPDIGRVQQAIMPIRWALDCHDLSEDGPASPLGDLRAATEQATTDRLASRYTRLADTLPGLLNELSQAAHTYAGQERETVFALLVMAYRAADAIADKYGFTDLSARTIDLMRWAAAQSGEPLLCGVAEYVRAELFFGRPHATAGLKSLCNAADAIDPGSSRDARAVYGSLHMNWYTRCERLWFRAGRAGRDGASGPGGHDSSQALSASLMSAAAACASAV